MLGDTEGMRVKWLSGASGCCDGKTSWEQSWRPHTRTHTELSSLSPWRVLDFMICLCLLSLVCNLNSFPCLGVWDFPDPCYYGEHFVFPFSLSTSFPDCSQTLARSLQSVSYYHVMCGFYCSLLVMELGTRRHSLVLYFECCFGFVFFSLWEAC